MRVVIVQHEVGLVQPVRPTDRITVLLRENSVLYGGDFDMTGAVRMK